MFLCRSGGCRRDGGDGEGGGAVSPDEQPGDTPKKQGQWDVSWLICTCLGEQNYKYEGF